MDKKEWEKVYLTYVNDNQESLANQAKDYLTKIYKEFINISKSEKTAFLFAVNLLASYIDADHIITTNEWALFNYIFDIDSSSAYGKLESIVEDFRKNTSYDELDNIIDNCDPELKKIIIKFGLCVCAIDEKITISEQEIIEKYAA